ncbi:uncharacterized protein N7458_010368 [Penicillium daleae]|uniref:(S)-ureidoglycine aminohydrolase cupin domain-containing protein n=1 Tax=Penicillium daleae TaxID=63821 RepID=A0AAD6BZ80_9EURO|nr:uncharacterized protein N7458_010368 [Penicillium daleae]KAJ5439370.1 hypothetical protein N7458_010368 [Penicillium daleae]
MVFQIKNKAEIFKIPKFDGIPNIYFGKIPDPNHFIQPHSKQTKPPADYLGTQKDTSSPITGSWFRIEKGPESTPPTYEYDEVGVVIEGEMTFRDETGQTATVKAGDTFFFPRGSTITFSTESHGVAWKCGGRLPSKL